MATKKLYDTLVGATVNVNQLFNPSNVEYGAFPFTKNGIEFTLSAEGRIILNGTATADTSALGFAKIVSGHKYYRKNLKSNSFNIFSYYPLEDESIVNATGDNEYAVMTIPNGTTVSNYEYCGMLIDLTTWFGSSEIADYLYALEQATPGAGVAKFMQWGFLTGKYIPYTPVAMQSVRALKHVTVGFNQWDEETERGAFDAQGNPFASSAIRCKNFIPVILGQTYYFKTGPNGIAISPFFYSADKKFVTRTDRYLQNQTFVVPDGCYYMKFGFPSAYGTTYNHDVCINLSSDRNGEYEPYSAHTYDLGTDTLRGLFKLDANNNLYADGDTKTSDGTVTRKYHEIIVDGSDNKKVSNVTLHSGSGLYYCTIRLSPISSNSINIVNDGGYVPAYGVVKGNIYDTSDGALLVIVLNDQTITTVDGANAYFTSHPLTVVYELATPTTEQSTPFTSPQICDPDGTEEYVTNNGIPVGHETRYQL